MGWNHEVGRGRVGSFFPTMGGVLEWGCVLSSKNEFSFWRWVFWCILSSINRTFPCFASFSGKLTGKRVDESCGRVCGCMTRILTFMILGDGEQFT